MITVFASFQRHKIRIRIRNPGYISLLLRRRIIFYVNKHVFANEREPLPISVLMRYAVPICRNVRLFT
jgi:hypothetical protein